MVRFIFFNWGPEDLREKLSRALQAPATFGNLHLVPGDGESSLPSMQHWITVELLTKFSLVQGFYQSAMVETFRPCAYVLSVQNNVLQQQDAFNIWRT